MGELIERMGDAEHMFRWVLTHEPIALFEQAARRFSEIIWEESGGRMAVDILTPSEYGAGRRISSLDVARRVASGEVQMSQSYTTVLGKLWDRLWALDLPFLFESHEHATRVLDGAIGKELLTGLLPAGLRGLAFTYSGGYRVIATTGREVHGIDDLQGLELRTSDNPVVTTLFSALGAHVHPAPLYMIPELTASGQIEAGESTWPRYWDMGHHSCQPVVSETGHSLFLTALVVNEVWYKGLPTDLQALLQSASLRVAKQERDKSIHDADRAREACLAGGGKVITPSSEELARFRSATRFVYDEFAPRFGAELIERIQLAS